MRAWYSCSKVLRGKLYLTLPRMPMERAILFSSVRMCSLKSNLLSMKAPKYFVLLTILIGLSLLERRKGEKLEFMVSFGGIKSTQVLDKLIVNLLAGHQMLSWFNSSVVVLLRVCELSSVTSKQASSANMIGLLCNALLRSLI